MTGRHYNKSVYKSGALTSIHRGPYVLHLQRPRPPGVLSPEVNRHKRPLSELALLVVVLPLLEQQTAGTVRGDEV